MERKHLFATRRSPQLSDSGFFLHLWVYPTFSSYPLLKLMQQHHSKRQKHQISKVNCLFVKNGACRSEVIDLLSSINREHHLCFHIGEEDEDVNPQAAVRTPWPPGGPEEPDQEKAGQAARLWSDLWQVQPELWRTGCGQHVQVQREGLFYSHRLDWWVGSGCRRVRPQRVSASVHMSPTEVLILTYTWQIKGANPHIPPYL